MRTSLRVALAWAPIWAMWVVVYLTRPGQSFAAAAVAATVAIGAAALLGLCAWWFTGVYSWPEELELRFYAVHLLTGSAFALLWNLAIVGADAARADVGLVETIRRFLPVLPWLYIMGLSTYGLVTGISYTVRTRGRLRAQERLAAEARLAALRNQLNPHFLFNALHSLSVLVRNDPASAQVAIEQLGDMLRYTLTETDAHEVPLSEEWRFTRTYLALEQIRFGSRLGVEEQLAPEAMACLVPAFTLQVLAENAVRHGIAPEPAGGVVSIRSTVEDGTLILEVSDTGAGAPTASGVSEPPRGHGLMLLRERLEALHRGRGTLLTTNQPGAGFKAIVTLPVSLE